MWVDTFGCWCMCIIFFAMIQAPFFLFRGHRNQRRTVLWYSFSLLSFLFSLSCFLLVQLFQTLVAKFLYSLISWPWLHKKLKQICYPEIKCEMQNLLWQFHARFMSKSVLDSAIFGWIYRILLAFCLIFVGVALLSMAGCIKINHNNNKNQTPTSERCVRLHMWVCLSYRM